MERLHPRFSETQPVRLTNEEVGVRLLSVIDFYRSHSLDPRLIGSTGRYASLGMNPPDRRTQEGGRDFDFVLLTARASRKEKGFADLLTEAREHTTPIWLDQFQQVSQGIILERGRSFIKYKAITLEVDPRVFEMHEGYIFGVTVPTFNPNTLFHLQALFAGDRREGIAKLVAFRQQYSTFPHILPEALFEPFHTMAEMRRTNYPKDMLINEMSALYRAHLPKGLRKSVHPLAKRAKEAMFNR